MDDVEIVRRINELAAEEHRLERAHAGDPLSETELERLHEFPLFIAICGAVVALTGPGFADDDDHRCRGGKPVGGAASWGEPHVSRTRRCRMGSDALGR